MLNCKVALTLKAIIDEHPSLVPVGVRNNSSGHDMSILAPSGNTSDFDYSDGLGLETENTTDVDVGGHSSGVGVSKGDDNDDGGSEGEGEGEDAGNGDVEEASC